jgi:hypothetical protein
MSRRDQKWGVHASNTTYGRITQIIYREQADMGKWQQNNPTKDNNTGACCRTR